MKEAPLIKSEWSICLAILLMSLKGQLEFPQIVPTEQNQQNQIQLFNLNELCKHLSISVEVKNG